jgi:DNA-binding NtrC family response regulator
MKDMDKPFRILIVDDDQNMTRTLADILAVSGYIAETAALAEDGLKKLEANVGTEHRSFDCVVSDIRMPGMNGVEFQRVIREKHGDIPVMLITAYAEHDLIEKARAQGVLSFLEKPLNISLLFSFLRRIASGEL